MAGEGPPVRRTIPDCVTTYDGDLAPKGRKVTAGSVEVYDRALVDALRAAGLAVLTPPGALLPDSRGI